MSRAFPSLDSSALGDTVRYVHQLSKELGLWTKQFRSKRKHWWHASLRPSLTGLTTGPIYQDLAFELTINLLDAKLEVSTDTGGFDAFDLTDGPVSGMVARARSRLAQQGVETGSLPEMGDLEASTFDADAGQAMGGAFRGVTDALGTFRAGIKEETSPIQLWPHHFDLSMIWLPGEKIPGQDPNDEEYSDKQMNFGFAFGDEGVSEPYFYVTAYPSRDGFRDARLPDGASWSDSGFEGVVVTYDAVQRVADSKEYLLELWKGLIGVGRQELLDGRP